MTEIFTTGPETQKPPLGNDRGMKALIAGALVFLIAAVGLLGLVLVGGVGNQGSEEVTTAEHDTDDARRADSKSLKSKEDASGDEVDGTAEEVDAEGVEATPPQTSMTQAAPVVPVTPVGIDVSFERPAVASIVCTGEPLAYSGAQLIDGDENFGWGASMSDAAGATATIRFGEPVNLKTVGMTPGYTRVAPRSDAGCNTVNAFPYNRFVPSVRWTFDDGTSVVQDFEQRPELQVKEVDVTTSNVTLTILSTTRPSSSDDETVISEAAFTGSR